MKKILLATTMLAGTAGFAAAEVAVTGYAEMGIWSNTAGEVAFHQDVEVTFAMSGTTDGGLEFGAKIDLDETNVVLNDDSGTTVFISGGWGTLTMGDTDGALDWAVQEAGSLTAITDDHTSHVGYFSANGFDGNGDGQIVRYDNTFGAFGVAVSVEQGDNGVGVADDILALGVKYTADLGGTALNVGLGYQKEGSDDVTGASVGAELAAGFSGMIGYTAESVAGVNTDRTGLGVTYTSGALSTHMNYGMVDVAGVSSNSWGMAVNYDLGGGAVVMAGYGSDVLSAPGSQDQWSVGLGLSF